ncbi:MAG: NUDIX hydrolase [Thermoleophilaceae bacterium]
MNEVVRAAGGVVLDDEGRVALVYRPKYDDWSFPKGKLEPGETEEQAALREVLEEAGIEAELGRELGVVSYRDPKDRPKTVRYWEMRRRGGDFTPNREVTELRWLPPEEAEAELSYDRDREILRRL